LKNSTRQQYEKNFKTYLIPVFGNSKLRMLSTVELQACFNSLQVALSPNSIRLIHGTLRALLEAA
jgi:hypothetical protein